MNKSRLNTTKLPYFKWMVEGATTTAPAIGSKWQEQAFGVGDHKPWLVPGQAQPPPDWDRGGYFVYENVYRVNFLLVTKSHGSRPARTSKAKTKMLNSKIRYSIGDHKPQLIPGQAHHQAGLHSVPLWLCFRYSNLVIHYFIQTTSNRKAFLSYLPCIVN